MNKIIKHINPWLKLLLKNLDDFILGIIILSLGFVPYSGYFYIICWCFNVVFTWKLSLGSYLCYIMISSMIETFCKIIKETLWK